MYVKSYEYVVPEIVDKDYGAIPGMSRDEYAVNNLIERTKTRSLDCRTGVLYSGGFALSENECRDFTGIKERLRGIIDYNDTTMLLRESSVYAMHRWIGSFGNPENVVYASINSNTCASSMYGIHEAERLLESGVCDEVIVIAEVRVGFNTIRLFREHRIPIIVSDGFAIVTFTKDSVGVKVDNTKWAYQYQTNPFLTTSDGYSKIDSPADNVKLHGTGTETNTMSEAVLEIDRKVVDMYKKVTGHTLSASALLELCMVMDDKSVTGTVLCSASGLGGFYGSCVLHKV